MDDIKHKDEVFSVLEELDAKVLEAIKVAGCTEDPTEGYREGRDILEYAVDELPCTTIESLLSGVLFRMLQTQVRMMMHTLQSYQCDSKEKRGG